MLGDNLFLITFKKFFFLLSLSAFFLQQKNLICIQSIKNELNNTAVTSLINLSFRQFSTV